MYVDIELDGPGHDEKRDRWRDEEVPVESMRVPHHELDRWDFWERFLKSLLFRWQRVHAKDSGRVA